MMQEKATSIESLMKQKTAMPAEQQHQQMHHPHHQKMKKKYVPPHNQPYVEHFNGQNPNNSASSFAQISPTPEKELSFFEKIKQDKDTMDLVSVAGIVFLITNSSISNMIKSKFPSAYKDGSITLQGNFLLAIIAVVALVIVRKLI